MTDLPLKPVSTVVRELYSFSRNDKISREEAEEFAAQRIQTIFQKHGGVLHEQYIHFLPAETLPSDPLPQKGYIGFGLEIRH